MELHRTLSGSETVTSPGICSSAEIEYLVTNVTNKDLAISEVYNNKPLRYKGLYYKEMRIGDYQDGTLTVTVVYSSLSSTSGDSSEDQESVASFDCSGGTKHVVHAINQRCVYGTLLAGTAVGWNGELGGKMQIAGVDVPIGQMRETYTKVMSRNKLTTAYKRKVARLTGRVNSKPFKGWEAGEVMFLGASYSAPESGRNKVTITFNFAVQENEDSMEISGIKVGKKLGWEHVWAVNGSQVSSEVPEASISAIYVAQVAKTADFKELGV